MTRNKAGSTSKLVRHVTRALTIPVYLKELDPVFFFEQIIIHAFDPAIAEYLHHQSERLGSVSLAISDQSRKSEESAPGYVPGIEPEGTFSLVR